MKTWNDTIVSIIGTMKTDETGKTSFKANQYGKYTATLKVMSDSPWNTLGRKSTWVFTDGLREADVNAIKKLEDEGEITADTRLVFIGHLVRTPGKPGMNDMYNIKTMCIRPAMKDEHIDVKFEEALTKDEWNTIRKEKFGATAGIEAPTAPSAPVAPF